MNYLKTSIAGFQPINVVPVNEIKCSKCHKYFPKNVIQEHLNIHIKPQFILSSSNQNNIQKLSIPKGLKQQLKNQPDEIDVQTIMPEQLPTQQKERRNMSVPKGILQRSNNNIFDLHLDSLKVKVDEAQLTSKLGCNLKFRLEKPYQLLKLQEALRIPVSKTKLTKRSINVYQNKRVQINMENEKVQLKKMRATEKQKTEQVYEILSNKDSILTNQSSNKVKTIQCGFVNASVGVSTNFLTTSRFPNRMKNYKDNVFQEFLESVDGTLSMSKYEEHKCNNKCSCCGGFYCRVCNSAIPPQFRPVNFTDNEQIKSFWKMHYQHSKYKNCLS